jgi:hypothetical protein
LAGFAIRLPHFVAAGVTRISAAARSTLGLTLHLDKKPRRSSSALFSSWRRPAFILVGQRPENEQL